MTIKEEIKKAASDVSINDMDLTDSMMTQASHRLHYASVAAKAQAAADMAKMEVERTKATLDGEIRDEALESKRKLTEKMIESEIINSAVYMVAQKRLLAAKEQAEAAKAVVAAFDHRRDMLVQLSKHQLVEREGEVFLNGKGGVSETAKETALRAINGAA